MAQDFYNLEEAAKRLGLTTQELNAMAQHREIRAFADKGTWRFKFDDIEELATRRGLVSNPQFRLSDPEIKGPTSDVFSDDRKKPGVQGTGSGGKKTGNIGTPSGKAKSGDTGRVDLASIGGEDDDAPQSSSSFVFGNKPVSGMTDLSGPASPVTSDDDTVVQLGNEPLGLEPGDSRVRLDSPSGRLPDMGVHLVDFNMKPIADPPSSRKLVPPPIGKGDSGKVPGSSGKVPGGSGKIGGPKSDTGRIPPPKPSGAISTSSEFELQPTKQGPNDSIFDFTAPSMPEINLDLSGEAKNLVELGGKGQSPSQGGSMRAKLPAMEEESSTFELNLEPSNEELAAMPRTPRPDGGPKDTSSEFDLSLQVPEDSSSDFELSVDESSGSLSALDAVADTSGSSTAKISSDDVQVGEDSDFELALDDDSAVVDDTGSEVVVIEDEQSPTDLMTGGAMAASAAALGGSAAAKRRKGAAVEDEEAVVEPFEEEEAEEEYAAAPARAAEWGWISLVHLPTALIMIFTGFLLFEMVRSISGYETKNTFATTMFNLVKSMTN